MGQPGSAGVYATAADTYFGKTAELVQDAHTVSHFQKAVLKIGNYLIMLAVVLVATIIGVAIFRGDPILTTLQRALVLTVAAIPVAMPTVLSVTTAVGARLLAKKDVTTYVSVRCRTEITRRSGYRSIVASDEKEPST